jgi:hypothetical protein
LPTDVAVDEDVGVVVDLLTATATAFHGVRDASLEAVVPFG